MVFDNYIAVFNNELLLSDYISTNRVVFIFIESYFMIRYLIFISCFTSIFGLSVWVIDPMHPGYEKNCRDFMTEMNQIRSSIPKSEFKHIYFLYKNGKGVIDRIALTLTDESFVRNNELHNISIFKYPLKKVDPSRQDILQEQVNLLFADSTYLDKLVAIQNKIALNPGSPILLQGEGILSEDEQLLLKEFYKKIIKIPFFREYSLILLKSKVDTNHFDKLNELDKELLQQILYLKLIIPSSWKPHYEVHSPEELSKHNITLFCASDSFDSTNKKIDFLSTIDYKKFLFERDELHFRFRFDHIIKVRQFLVLHWLQMKDLKILGFMYDKSNLSQEQYKAWDQNKSKYLFLLPKFLGNNTDMILGETQSLEEESVF